MNFAAYHDLSDHCSFLAVRRMMIESQRGRSWMGFMQAAPQLAPCLVLADRRGVRVNSHSINGINAHSSTSRAEIFDARGGGGGNALVMTSWKDFKKWKEDSRKFDRTK